MLIEGLHYCSEKELYSAGGLKSTVIYFHQLKADKDIKKLYTTLPTQYHGTKPQVEDLRIYEDAIVRGIAFIDDVLGVEIKYRQNKALEKQIKKTGFPYEKYLKDFDLNFCQSITSK